MFPRFFRPLSIHPQNCLFHIFELFAFVFMLATVTVGDDKPATKGVTGTSLSEPSKVWTVDLEISAKDYEAMQPPPPAGFGPPGAPAPAPRNTNGQRDKSLLIREPNSIPRELKLNEIESRVIQKQSNMP